MSEELTAERVRELFDYDPQTGVLTWKIMRPRARPGDVAGSPSCGYVRVGVCGRSYQAHRLAWLHAYGAWPADVDHINGNRSDNRLSNLREATRSENLQNLRAARSDNRSSGVLGVSRNLYRWQARIQVDGRRQSIGTFATVAEASAAYLEAKRQLHPFGTI